MNQKPKSIGILFGLWIAIGILILVITIIDLRMMEHLGVTFPRDFYIQPIFYLILAVISFVLAYGVMSKKNWAWLGSLMFSSFLLYQFGVALQSLAFIFGRNYHVLRVENIAHYIALYLELAFAILIIYLSTRSQVKAYFGKT